MANSIDPLSEAIEKATGVKPYSGADLGLSTKLSQVAGGQTLPIKKVTSEDTTLNNNQFNTDIDRFNTFIDTDKGWQRYPAFIDVDKDNRKVTIRASKSVLDSDAFKETYDTSTFKQLMKAYMDNPDTKFTGADGKEHTVSEAFESYKKELKSQSQRRKVFDDIAKSMSDSFGVDKWSDAQVRRANTFYSSDVDKNVAIPIPKWALGSYDFTQYDSWNEESRTISAEDFKKFYSTTAFDDQHVMKMQKTAREMLAMMGQYQTSSSQEAKDYLQTDEMKDEIADTLSFYSSLFGTEKNPNKPSEDFLTSVGNFVMGAGVAFGNSIIQMVDNFSEFLIWTSGDTFASPLSFNYVLGHGLQALSEVGYAFEDLMMNGNPKEAINNFFANVAEDYDIPRANLENIFGDYKLPEEFTADFFQERGAVSGSFGSGMVIGNIMYKIVENVMLLNPVGSAAMGGLVRGVNGLVKLTKYGMETMDAVRLAKVAEGALNLLGKANSLAMATAPSFAANVLAQGILETIADEPEAMKKLFADGNTSPVAWKILENTMWNAVGEVSGVVTKGIGDAWKSTEFGKSVNMFFGKKMNALGAKKNEIFLNIARKLSKLPLDDSVAAGEREFREALIDAQKSVANADTYEAYKKALLNRMNLENKFRALHGGVTNGIQTELYDNPKIGKALRENDANVAKVANLSTKSGYEIPKGAAVPQDVADYLSYRVQRDYYLTKQKIFEANNKRFTEVKKLDALTKKCDALRKEISGHGKDLVQAVDKNYRSLQRAAKLIQNFKLKHGLTDSDKIKEKRDTGYWGKKGDKWFRTQRIDADQDYEGALSKYEQEVSSAKAVKRGEYLGDKDYQISKGDVDSHFLDPNVVLLGEEYQAVLTLQGKQWGQALLNTSGVHKVIGYDERVTSAKNFNRNYADFKKSVSSYVASTEDFGLSIEELGAQVGERLRVIAGKRADISQQIETLSKEQAVLRQKVGVFGMGQVDIMELSTKVDLPNFDPSDMTAASFKGMYDGLDDASQKFLEKQLKSFLGDNAKVNVTNYRKLYNGFDTFGQSMTKTYISNTADILESDACKEILERIHTEELDARAKAFLKDEIKQIDEIKGKITNLMLERESLAGKTTPLDAMDGEQVVKNAQELTEDIVTQITNNVLQENPAARTFVRELTERGLPKELATRYAVLNALQEGRSKKAIYKMVENSILGDEGMLDASIAEAKDYVDAVNKVVESSLESQYNTLTRQLIDSGYEEFVDTDALFTKVKAEADKIAGKVDSPNVIRVLDDRGKIVYVETDPVYADLYTYRPNYGDVNTKTVRFFNNTNRLFRLGTTGFNLTSLANQWVKDPVNAFVMGGTKPFLDTKMSRLFGGDAYARINDEVVENLKGDVIANLRAEWGDDGWKAFQKECRARGVDASRAAVEYELNVRPSEMVTGGTQTKEYQAISKARQESFLSSSKVPLTDTNGVRLAVNAANNILDKIENVLPNASRETYLRNAVYVTNYQKALTNGKSVKEARTIAEFFMNNATTDFSRAFMLGNRIIRSIPYLGAALNGSASFWRLLEIDPVGISGRFIGGIILPYTALIAESLADERNREVYKNIREYEKEGNLVFVSNGQAFSIPMPEEIGAFLNIFRHTVESAADANDYSWLQLMTADVLELPALDLSGFYDLNQNQIYNDIGIGDRLSRGFEKLIFGQMAPVTVKTAYMAATGRDPYTGNEIDRSYVYIDEDMNIQIMDTDQNLFAKGISNWMKSLGWNLSPSAAHKLLNNVFGNSITGLGDSLTSLLSGDVLDAAAMQIDNLAKPFTVNQYNLGQADWKKFVGQMYDEKTRIMNSEEFKNYSMIINRTTTSDEGRQKALSGYRTFIQNYQQKVVDGANNMRDKYGITVAQQASVISLLTMFDNGMVLPNASDQDKSQDLRNSARNQALETMSKLGFNGTTDLSIFGYGYYQTDPATGEKVYKYKYNSAPDILEMGNRIWGQAEITLGNIKRVMVQNGLETKYSQDISKQISAIYDDKSKSHDDKKKEADEIKKEWNAEVFETILPYIEAHGITNLLENSEVIDYLDNYLLVPTSWMGKGQYISSSKLNKQKGFAKSYIQAIYKAYKGE